MRQEAFEKFVVQNRKKYDAFNLSAAFTGRVCELLQVSMTEMILRIKLQLTMLKSIANALQKRVGSNYRFVLSFNSALILLGALGILPPATSAILYNLSTPWHQSAQHDRPVGAEVFPVKMVRRSVRRCSGVSK